MRVISTVGREDVAIVYIAETQEGKLIEFVESVQPPIPREKKWVLIISTLYGCPVKCGMCDAGIYYSGRISKDVLFAQVDFLVKKRYPDRIIPSEKFKIQFSRIGEPSFNMNVLNFLEEFPHVYTAPGFTPSISTIAPNSTEEFFNRLIDIKNRLYSNGKFQFQFSIHTTDSVLRDKLIPVNKWSFEKMSRYGENFHNSSDKKIALNFAASMEYPIEPNVIGQYFDPSNYIIKITPLNPTYQAKNNNLTSYISSISDYEKEKLKEKFMKKGYEIIISIGELEENKIGSNCGQYLQKHLSSSKPINEGYSYKVNKYL